MARIQFLSDIHLEFRHNPSKFLEQTAVAADVAVLAGDITNWYDPDGVRDVLSQIGDLWDNAIYVLGNHEYYGLSPLDVKKQMKDLKGWGIPENVHVVATPRVLDVAGVRFVCGTGWYSEEGVRDAGYSIDEGISQRRVQFNDFKNIQDLAPWCYGQNQVLHDLLMAEARPDTVVVTHHLPVDDCVVPRYRGVESNCFFVAGLGRVILERRPKLWIHGHTHSDVDVIVGETRIVANPCGYPGERIEAQARWIPGRTIDVR